MQRVLIANRGEIARRLIRYYAERGVETVAVFSEPDVEQPWVDEADYAVYLNGDTVAETYRHAVRVVSAALDAGCDIIHPGYCFLADDVGFATNAMNSGVVVVGADHKVLARVSHRDTLRAVAETLGIPLIPASTELALEADGYAEAAQIGVPLLVRAVAGDLVERVDDLEEIPAAVARVRSASELVHGEGRVYLERAVEHLRHCGTLVAADQHGEVAHLGTSEGSLQAGYGTWIEEMGDELVSHELQQRLGQAAVELARALEWVGVGRVRWGLDHDGGWYLLGFSPRLTIGYSLAEQLYDVDLIETQHRVLEGEPLGWEHADTHVGRHAIQLRVLHVDPQDGWSRPEGFVERLVLPEGVCSEVGTAEGQPCTPHTDPLLVKLTVSAPTRHAALVKARAALDELVVEGVSTNRDLLRKVLASEVLWLGEQDVHTLDALLGG